jgi:glycosyltransferase involved in cell wall biosynthesis
VSDPLVSVLLASRDGERHLAESLASLAAQTWQPLEVLLVDDGSRDGTRARLEAFARGRPGVRVLDGGGVGLAGALALAASAAHGELLARQDDDDISAPERLARQVAAMHARPDVTVLGTAATVIDEHGAPLGPYRGLCSGVAARRALRRGPPLVHGAVMMRTAAYRAAGGYRAAFRASQDYDLWLRMPGTIANLDAPLYRWRRHAGGAFARARDQQLQFAALARLFAAERRQRDGDSYDAFAAAGTLEAFLERSPLAGRLCLLVGEAYARDGRVAEARRWLARALERSGPVLPSLGWWCATWGIALTPRGRRHARAGAAS